MYFVKVNKIPKAGCIQSSLVKKNVRISPYVLPGINTISSHLTTYLFNVHSELQAVKGQKSVELKKW